MTNPKTYFLTRGWDFPVNSITLGSIITNPMQPQLALFRPSPDKMGSPVHVTEKPLFSSADGAGSGGSGGGGKPPGLFRTFVSLFGLGNEESFQYDRKSVLAYSFRGLRASRFEPGDELMREAVAQERPAQFLRASGYSASLYMITGVKSICGAGVTTASGKGTGWRVALSVGLEESADSADGAAVGSPAVFAFQVVELKVSSDGVVTMVGVAEQSVADFQARLDREFGEAEFEVSEGLDEEDGASCRIVAPSPACVDLLTAGSARIDHTVLHSARE
ncbi:hypothetical protein MFIFM68171_11081 [Madurella fahalii]|uniref:Uncharacterized protein n=1 Tax=Madurella fahalii TaxID=1157608 RepID=A0ABQ0GSZ2_9PEZI